MFLVFYISFIFELLIVSTPPAIPIVISPAARALATVATDWSPDEHSLLMPWTVVVSG